MKELKTMYDYDGVALFAQAWRASDGKLWTLLGRVGNDELKELTEDSILTANERRAIMKLIPLLEEDGDYERAQWLKDNCLMREEHRVWIDVTFPESKNFTDTELLTKRGKLFGTDFGDYVGVFKKDKGVIAKKALDEILPVANQLLDQNHYEDPVDIYSEPPDVDDEEEDDDEEQDDVSIVSRKFRIDGVRVNINIYLPLSLFGNR